MADTNTQSLWLDEQAAALPVDAALGDQLTGIAQQHPTREAVVYAAHDEVDNVRWRYGELDRMATDLARALLARGYRPGERIAIWAPNHPRWILLEYALARAGIVIVALNPLYKRAELAFALKTAGVAAIFHAREVGGEALRGMIDTVRAELPDLREVYTIDDDVSALLAAADTSTPLPSVAPDACLMIQYTSGTTGQPKAAQLSHRGVATTARNSYRTWGFGAGDRVCHGFPLFHVGGSGNSTPGAALVAATTLPLYIFKARRTLDILEREHCTGFIGVPSMLSAMMDDPTFDSRRLDALRRIVVGGAGVPQALIRRCEDAFGVEVINSYGQTESSGVSCSTVAGDSAAIKATTSGRPLPGISLKVIDGGGATVARNIPGELCYRGPGTMLGYLHDTAPEQTVDGEGWLRSGDLATMDEAGYVRIVGRVKEMIIRGGENLSPLEIESFLITHPAIAEAAVLGLPDAKYGEEVCAVLLPQSASHPDAEAIRQWCADNLSRWKVPRYIAFARDFPRTASGKVQKFRLRQRMIQHFGLSGPEVDQASASRRA
jgi:fatty-acyl-CoA synthase